MQEPKNHAIQLATVRVIETTLRVFDTAATKEEGKKNPIPFKFSVSHTPFNQEEKSIVVGITGQFGNDKQNKNFDRNMEHSGKRLEDSLDDEYPFFISVRLAGVFIVDTDNFPVDEIHNWAKMNPPIVLYPFLRGHIYGLATRAGIREVILPMVTLPMYKLDKSNTAQP